MKDHAVCVGEVGSRKRLRRLVDDGVAGAVQGKRRVLSLFRNPSGSARRPAKAGSGAALTPGLVPHQTMPPGRGDDVGKVKGALEPFAPGPQEAAFQVGVRLQRSGARATEEVAKEVRAHAAWGPHALYGETRVPEGAIEESSASP